MWVYLNMKTTRSLRITNKLPEEKESERGKVQEQPLVTSNKKIESLILYLIDRCVITISGDNTAYNN